MAEVPAVTSMGVSGVLTDAADTLAPGVRANVDDVEDGGDESAATSASADCSAAAVRFSTGWLLRDVDVDLLTRIPCELVVIFFPVPVPL